MVQNSTENYEIGDDDVKNNEKKRKYVKTRELEIDEENVKELRIIKERIPILKSERYTGFLGIIISLRNIFELQKYCTTYGMSFLLSYKVLQDHLENFFQPYGQRVASTTTLPADNLKQCIRGC